MAVSYKPGEVFEMAIEIERRGVGFYEKAASNAKSSEVKELLNEMSKMEKKHEQTFIDMKAELSQGESAVYDPDNETAYYLREVAAGKGWEGKASPGSELSGDESIEDILKIAIQAEKDSIEFYVGLKEVTDKESNKDKIEAIIKEEMTHVATLKKALDDMAA